MRGIPFLKKNFGAHLIVNPEQPTVRVDFWPGPGTWRFYWGDKSGVGLESLLEALNQSEIQP
jgi:hypothetical protein